MRLLFESCLFVLASCPAMAALPQEGLLLWLDAADRATVHVSDDSVESWDNKAAGGGAVTSSGEQRPQYLTREGGMARPALLFDGIDDALIDAAFARHAEHWTLVVVAAPSAGGGGGLVTATSRDGHDYDPGFTVDLYSSGSQFDCISVEGAGRIGGQQDQMVNGYSYDTMHVIVVERGDGMVRLFVDGHVEGERPMSEATTVMDALRVGARYFGGAERAYFCGEIAQVLLYDRLLEPAERDSVERQLFVSSMEREALAKETEQRRIDRERNRMVAARVVHSWPTIDAFLTDQPGGTVGALHRTLDQLPVRTNMREAIALGMTHLVSLFDADRDNEPFFYANCRADGTGEMHHSLEIGIPHVVGRALLGIVAGERATGIPLDAEGFAILERYCRQSFDNPYALNAYLDPKRDNAPFVEFHNMREGLFGLWALIVATDSGWAKETASKMVHMLDSITDVKGEWSDALIVNTALRDRYSGKSVPNAARLVDALLAYHRATGDAVAMKLADAYARAGLRHMFEEDGQFAPMDRSSGHVHSITSSLSGITDYAIQTGDTTMLAQCMRIMERGVPAYHSSWGWGDEVFPDHPANLAGRGEINQTGDVVRTALLLGAVGHPEYYEMAERWLRGMLLPTQHREDELRAYMHDTANPESDAKRDVIRRSVGGYAMQLPNDRMREGDWPITTLDITSGAVHALAACYAQRVTKDGDACYVNLLFDYDDPEIQIESSLPFEGRIDFRMNNSGILRIRIPQWVDRDSLRVTVDGATAPLVIHEGYLNIHGQSGAVGFDVPCRVEKETVDNTEYTTTWVGNQIVDITPRGKVSPIPF